LNIRLVHGKAERTLQTASCSKFDVPTLAWYSDVKHEVKPILSGYRLALTYNLLQDQCLPKQDAASLELQHTHFAQLFRARQARFSAIEHFVYPLERDYTNASICLRNLKGADAAKGRLLEQVCAKNGVYWFLGTLTRTTKNEDYYGIGHYSETELSLSVNHIVTPAGTRIIPELSISEDDHILGPDLYDGRSPEFADEEEFTGNEAIPSNYRYHYPVLILMRKDTLFKLCAANNSNCYGYIDSLEAFTNMVQMDMLATPEDGDSTITALLAWLLAELHSGHRDPRGNAKIRHLFDNVACFCYSDKRPYIVRQALVRALKQKDVGSSAQILDLVAMQLAKEILEGDTLGWHSWFSQPPQNATLEDLLKTKETFHALERRIPPSTLISFKEWEKEYLERGLCNIDGYGDTDILSLVSLIPLIGSELYLSW
jgi:hypothetical protein